jgi:hypothetical protein
VAFNVPVAEMTTADALGARNQPIRDLVAGSALARLSGRRGRTSDQVAQRMSPSPTRPLDQSAIAGIGNVLQVGGFCLPAESTAFARVDALAEGAVERLVALREVKFMRANVADGCTPPRSKRIGDCGERQRRHDRGARTVGGVRPRGQAVPPLRHADFSEETWSSCQKHVLVTLAAKP